MSLSVKKIARLNEPGRYFDKDNLYLQVRSKTNKSWLLRYVLDGRERWCGLGPLRTLNLEEARERCRKFRQLLLDGIDPIEHKRQRRAAKRLEDAKSVTFETCFKEYLSRHEKKWKSFKHRQQFENSVTRYALPKIGKLSVAAIDTGLVLRCLEPIWERIPITGDRIRNRIEAVLDWAKVHEYRMGDNPARWSGHLENLLPSPSKLNDRKHYAALPYAELPTFMGQLSGQESIAARALEFLILTAARTGEVCGATWNEVNLRERTWTIPASRMKAKKDHKVPLSDRAVELLQQLPRVEGNPHIFPGPTKGGKLNDLSLRRLQKTMGRSGDVTNHGFRATFKTWATERTNYPNHVVEQALAHSIGNAVERAYQRSDMFEKRIRLMADWARYCSTPIAEGATVVSINRR
jgi:integrase